VNKHTVFKWVKLYREQGESGLRPNVPYPGSRKDRLPAVVKRKIVAIKKEHPGFGVKKISQWLKRVLTLPGSPETVRKTLHQKKLIHKTRRKPAHNPAKPRFFERTTPNQMWQTDIFSWRMSGHNTYLIGFIDDFSRYVVGLGVHRSQTTEHVMETYRRAVADYGAPKELLSDNGRQYVAWQGKTKFQQELAKERIHHIRSAPHHPMTLGKIERFWKTIWTEFLERARFESFEEAQSRIALWVKYYNHKRPHQSLEGMCPADRFFGIQNELRDVIEKTIEQNILEQAMGREPAAPFYMVGRLGDQSVVIRSEKGQVKMLIDPQQPNNQGEQNEQAREQETHQQPHSEATGTGGALDLDGKAAGPRSDQRDVDQLDDPGSLAIQSDGGDAQGIGTQKDGSRARASTGPTPGKVACPQSGTGVEVEQAGNASGKDPASQESIGQITTGGDDEPSPRPATSADEGPTDRAGPERAVERQPGGCQTRRQPQDLLQVGEARPGGDGASPDSERSWPALEPDRSGEAKVEAPEPGASTAAHIDRTEPEDPSAP